MNCEYRVELDWKGNPPYIPIGLCKLQKYEPVYCPKFKQECSVYIKEYNLDTSVRHSEMNDDIVRTTSNKEGVELQNKESVR